MGSADEVNIQASELNRTMKVSACAYRTCCALTPPAVAFVVPSSGASRRLESALGTSLSGQD
jgi:hypothetical protein